jgi:hypothetical protein
MPSGRVIIPAAAALLAGLGLTALATTRPPSATERIQQGHTALSDNDLARAERIAVAVAEANQPGSWRAWLIAAAARQRQGRYQQAQDAYRQFLALCDRPAERAHAMEQIQRCHWAVAPRKPAVVSQMLNENQRRALALVSERPYTESTEHFAVQAYNAELAKLVARQAETALARICEEILSSQAYPHIVNVYVWPDAVEYQKHATSAAEWAGGSFSLTHGEDGQLIRRIDLTQLDKHRHFDTGTLDRVLPHEMCHLVLAEYFGDAHCPLALNEGLAMMAEAAVDNARLLLAGAALAGNKKIALPGLLRTEGCSADNADVFYAESFSLTAYLHARLTREQFREMLAQIKAGFPLDEALQRALYVPPDPAFLERLARAWEAEAIRQAQFLKALDANPLAPS